MKTVINYTIDTGIFVKFGDLDRDLRMKLCKFYFFTEKNSYNEKPQTINLVSLIDFGGEKCLKFTPNESYFKDCIRELGLEVGDVSDFRCDKKLEGFKTNITLRDNQIDMVKQLEACDFNGLITSKTSAGKTVLSLKLAEILQVSMLFVVPRVSLMDNLLKDIEKFGIEDKYVTKVNTEWLQDKKFTNIMYCSAAALQNPEILEALKDNIALVVFDELHLLLYGEKTRNNIQAINSKYKVYLSATPTNLNFDNIHLALLSPNIITVEEEIDYKIQIANINITPKHYMVENYFSTRAYHKKKEAIYTEEYLKLVAEAVAYSYLKLDRQCVVYCEDKNAQERVAKLISLFGLSVGVLNSNTKLKVGTDIINTFDAGKYQVIVSGTSISAGVSIYRLSTIFDISLTLNSNNLEQITGRLKRKDEAICDKSKCYIKFTFNKLTSQNWDRDKECLAEFDYMDFSPIRNVRFDNLEVVSAVKSILS